MSRTPAKYITDLFCSFEEAGVRYALLRDNDGLLPERYNGEGDVDIIINPFDKSVGYQVLRQKKWYRALHPYDNLKNFTFLYGMEPFDFFIRGNAKLDICYELACRSTNNGEWVPLDQLIQDSVWSNRVRSEAGFFVLSPSDECVHLIARSLFDLRHVSTKYRRRIEFLLTQINHLDLLFKMRLVFFGATEKIFAAMQSQDYDHLPNCLFNFSEY